MSEYVQENRRAVIMLAVALAVALLGGLYLLLSGGGDAVDTGAVPQGQRPTPSPSVETEEPTDPIVATVVGRGTNANPFGPLAGSEEDVSDSGSESDTTDNADTSSAKKKTSSYGTTNTDPSATVDTGGSTSTDPADDVSGADSGDDKPKEETNVVPEPINSGKDAEDGVSVAVVEVTGDYVIARVEGDRTKLYINIPGEQGVVYVAPLGGDCAWMGRTETEVRVSVCEGKTGQL